MTLAPLNPTHESLMTKFSAEGLSSKKGNIVDASGLYNEAFADGHGNGYLVLTDGRRVFEYASFRNRQSMNALGGQSNRRTPADEQSLAAFQRIGTDLVTLLDLTGADAAQAAIGKVGMQSVMKAAEACAWDQLDRRVPPTFSANFATVNLVLTCELRRGSLWVLHWTSSATDAN